MSVETQPLLDSLSALADPTRSRMLWLLDRQELTVSELCAILQLPQSTVSRHLKTLADADWVSPRREGTSRYYSLARPEPGRGAPDGHDGPRAQIWSLTKEQLAARPGADQDARRLARVVARRRETSERFFATSAGEWDELREELFGREFVWGALVALLPEEWVVGDLGCGTGAMLPVLAPHVARVIGVDAAEKMLAAARERARRFDNVELRAGALEALPLQAESLDAATMMLVLHHVAAPVEALQEAARVLKPGARLLIVDMAPHEHEEYRQRMGHVWLGFSDDHVRRLLTQAGFESIRILPLAPDSEAKGPSLFAASAQKLRTSKFELRT
jgi:ubiquinone/menaquinone biosynthesis C-methylase UbiE/DNA-binding transcriptional ArsR family regulator